MNNVRYEKIIEILEKGIHGEYWDKFEILIEMLKDSLDDRYLNAPLRDTLDAMAEAIEEDEEEDES